MLDVTLYHRTPLIRSSSTAASVIRRNSPYSRRHNYYLHIALAIFLRLPHELGQSKQVLYAQVSATSRHNHERIRLNEIGKCQGDRA